VTGRVAGSCGRQSCPALRRGGVVGPGGAVGVGMRAWVVQESPSAAGEYGC
jgi:hypothetical protein